MMNWIKQNWGPALFLASPTLFAAVLVGSMYWVGTAHAEKSNLRMKYAEKWKDPACGPKLEFVNDYSETRLTLACYPAEAIQLMYADFLSLGDSQKAKELLQGLREHPSEITLVYTTKKADSQAKP